jgi:hypothetical protein
VKVDRKVTFVNSELLAKFGWEVLDHPPYSPGMAPSEYEPSIEKRF